jgi:phosphatidylinositol-3-phosphatase
MKVSSKFLGLCVALVLCTSIGVPLASGQSSPQAKPATLPSFSHVFLVVGENLDYATTYSTKNMPYLTGLANKYGLATTYYSSTHPSIGNYENMMAGAILTNDDSQTPSSFPISSNNIAEAVQTAGKTWKDYVESDPNISGCGAYHSGTYYVRHDPLEYYTDVNTQKANFVCFSQFATDLSSKALPNFSYLSPNGYDDAHDSTAKAFDNWLKAEIAPLLASAYFTGTTLGNNLLIVTFDENATNGSPDCTTTTEGKGCGGKVETVLISNVSIAGHKQTGGDPQAYKKGYDEGDIGRTIVDGLGVSSANLGWISTAVDMSEFFN